MFCSIVSVLECLGFEFRYRICLTQQTPKYLFYPPHTKSCATFSNIKNPIIGNQSPHGYVLKIQNSLDSRKTGFIDAQTQLMIFLGQKDINCPRPIMNINGKYFSHERFTTDDQLESTNVVRLLQFVPGRLFHQIATKSSHLFYQAGQYVARLDTALRHFQHEAYAHHRTLWQMEATPRLADFVYALHDETKREIVDQVLEAYERRVAPHAADFGRGIIHGDFNEQNIVVSSSKSDDPNVEATWRIEGIIDFGDTVESCYVFELAIAMTYMMLQSGELSTGGLVLAGYQTIRPLPLAELQVLRVCVAARLCQSLVLGAYSHSLEPENDYLLTTQAAGWKLLDDLWSQLPEKDVLALWQSTADAYLTRSEK